MSSHDVLRRAADLALDETRGIPFDSPNDVAIAAAWLYELADEVETRGLTALPSDEAADA